MPEPPTPGAAGLLAASESIVVGAPPERVWPVATDITLPTVVHGELQLARWLDAPPRRPGARFVGTNRNDVIGEWRTTCTVTEYDAPRVFAWAVEDVESPIAWWRFELASEGIDTRVTQRVRIGPGESGLSQAMRLYPNRAERIAARRLRDLAEAMRANLERIRDVVHDG